MKEVLSEIEVWKARGDRIALATVIDVQRSAPRPPGAQDGRQRARGDRGFGVRRLRRGRSGRDRRRDPPRRAAAAGALRDCGFGRMGGRAALRR